jgi:pimeloyl-ACP methyl ester carboxylesterase
VTQYLIEREPVVFDPERVAREAPEWMNEMITLHSELNGKEYWRDLLQMTMEEIISEPNYTPADLAKVTRPTLVIMGAEDTVNAPDKHAQYIAENIPNAELWIPKNGHSVHKERRDEWLAEGFGFFWNRRGKIILIITGIPSLLSFEKPLGTFTKQNETTLGTDHT